MLLTIANVVYKPSYNWGGTYFQVHCRYIELVRWVNLGTNFELGGTTF
jgi:hypothetical protein